MIDKVVVVGAGYWGRNYIRDLGSNCVAFADVSKEVREYTSKNTFAKPFVKYSEVDISHDAVVIATPPWEHFNIALEALERGKKVLIEKPMCGNAATFKRLGRYSHSIMCGLTYLFHPGIEDIKRIYEMGDWTYAYARRTNHGPIRPWLQARHDLATHDISIFNHLTNEVPATVLAVGDRNATTMQLVYPSLSAQIYVSWFGGPKQRFIELYGEKYDKRYKFDDITASAALEISPLRRLLVEFLTEDFSKASYDVGLKTMEVLDACQVC